MAQQTEATDEAQNETTPDAVLQFENDSTGAKVTVTGEVTDRTKRYDADWCNEWVTVTDEDGKDFEIRMTDTMGRRVVKCNGHKVGNWYAFLN